MPDVERTTCRKCQRPVLRCENLLTGRTVALDPIPREGGTVRIFEHGDALPVKDLAEAYWRQRNEGALLYVPHMRTCTANHQGRKRRPARTGNVAGSGSVPF